MPQAYGFLAKAYLAQGRNKDAVATFEALMQANPRIPDAYRELALLYLDTLKNAEQASHYAKQGAAKFPRNAQMQDVLGWVYFQQQRYDQAAKQFRQAVSLSEENPFFLYHLGLSLEKQGNRGEAREVFQQALELHGQARGDKFGRELEAHIQKNTPPPQ